MADGLNLRERLIYLVNPEQGFQRYRERVIREKQKPGAEGTKRDAARMAVSYFGRHGASTTLNSMIGWLVGGGGAEDDIDVHGALLRKRARDLYAGGGLARSGPNTLTTNVIGWGNVPKPKIDGDLLHMNEQAVDEWERNTLREFKLWAENSMCDAERQQNFYGLQWLAFLSMLVSGDVFALFGAKDNKRTPYTTTIRLLEADRVATPDSAGESTVVSLDNGGRIVDGVELDREGAVVRYHIASHHPLAENDERELTFTSIDAYGRETGYPNILHIMTYERPEQRRGVPFVAANIENLKQFDRYMTGELAAQVVSSMLTAFIINEEDGSNVGLEDAVDEEEKVTNDELHLELKPGAIYDLPPGKTVQSINPLRQNSAFESFVTTLENIIGSSMDIPKEVLIKKYDSNYTAARSALLDFWKTVRVYRTRFNQQFNQPIYEQWLAEAVALGRVQAPGFFDDPAIRRAWCGCLWTGVTMGHVDPLKEVKAAVMRIDKNLSTVEQEASEYNGGDWREIMRQRRKEQEAAGDEAVSDSADINDDVPEDEDVNDNQ